MEVVVYPARTNTAETVFHQLEREGTRVISTAAEAHNQLGKVERHGRLFEVFLTKVLDQAQPKNQQDYEQCVLQTMNAKNELINQKGFVSLSTGLRSKSQSASLFDPRSTMSCCRNASTA